jgi:hypothetical protein
MKTTIEISDVTLKQARKLAAREGTTLRALVELGLRRVIAEKQQRGEFKLRRASFKGKGLTPGLRNASWDRLRELAYEEHGG